MNALAKPPAKQPTAARVFITSAYADAEPVTTFIDYARQDRIGRHRVVSDPAEADIILFIEHSHYLTDYFFSDLRNHELVRRYPQKVYMYNPHDRPWFVLPGLYMSMPKNRFDSQHMAAGPYIETINPHICCDFAHEPEHLFSFLGSITSSVRQRLASFVHPRANIAVSTQSMFELVKPQGLQLDYATLLKNSKYILCPRGAGTSSIRLFETMKAGRVPVVIADDFVYPKGPIWKDFAIIVPENNIDQIPVILERDENRWFKKAQLARQAWEQFYAPDTIFNYFIDSLLTLLRARPFSLPVQLQHNATFYYYALRKIMVRPVKEAIAKARATW